MLDWKNWEIKFTECILENSFWDMQTSKNSKCMI